MLDRHAAPLRLAPATCVVLSLVLGSGFPPLVAQEPAPEAGPTSRSFPDALVVQPLLDGSTRIGIGGGPMLVDRDPPTASGELSPEADAAFGYRLPLYRFRDGRAGAPAVDLAVEGGLIARFALGEGHNGLINSDFRVAFPVGVRFGHDWEAIFALAHVSSHLGDNLLEQTPILEANRVSRNGLEAMVLRRFAGGLRIYGGGTYNFATADTEEFAGRLGLNLDQEPGKPRSAWALGSVNFELTDLAEQLSVDAMAGIGIRTGPGELRLGLTGHVGPSPMGQFRTVDEKYVGLFLDVVPGTVARSGGSP